MGYRKVGTANRRKILHYLLPLSVGQLFMLRAAVELESKSADEAFEADLCDGRQARDMTLMLQVINERLKSTSLHNFRPQKPPGRTRMLTSPEKPNDLYSSIDTGDAGKPILVTGYGLHQTVS